ncbi:hypothetical protein RND71_039756 [Anisodus tanguticus]|uniref:Uncharacterized protein n=1 Tax=Anisodus tanguticus TaxID=243964 RepID=A0AAE1QX27_9SOLA|nr:hypothetical protein RND71_039756 [Anisodus tanguticus]
MSIALANDLFNLISLRIRVYSRIYIQGMNPNLGSTTTFNPHHNVPNTSRISTYKSFELRTGSKSLSVDGIATYVFISYLLGVFGE